VIVVDTSALMAIVLGEPEADTCIAALAAAETILISAGTLAEAMIVAGRRGVANEIETLVGSLGLEVVPVTEAAAMHVADAYSHWGRGIHSAGLNFGDCFAYATAKDAPGPLLFVGDDFTRTDIEVATSPAP
jgi:ribonuclease VapC